jgi:hypothetical protein
LVVGIFEAGSLKLPSWPSMSILLISASWVASTCG